MSHETTILALEIESFQGKSATILPFEFLNSSFSLGASLNGTEDEILLIEGTLKVSF